MNKVNSDIIISKSSSWYLLFLPLVTSMLLLYSDGNWTNWFLIISPFVDSYTFLCFGVQFVRFYEDSMVIIHPFNLLHIKTVITYNKIERISDALQRSTFLSCYDLHVYVKDKKRPIGIPMPSPRQKREQFMKLIETKGIRVEWGIYG